MSNAGPYRLSSGGQIDRARSVSFSFNGRGYSGFAGDTLASALLGTGVRTVARSFKFHRPRGVFSCGVEEPNALLQIGAGASTVPSERAPHLELTEGLQAHAQIGWPSVDFDLGRSMDFIAPLWSAGFYNRTFMWPSWHTWEPMIRRMAGLGRSPTEPDPDRYEISNLHCDVVVVGGGRAGLQAALREGSAGARVVLVEQDRQFGGRASWDDAPIDGLPARTWIDRSLAQLSRLPDVRLLLRTTATGHYDHNVITLVERVGASSGSSSAPRERYWIVRAQKMILATGAIEQPLIFANNDRPGIMLASAARQYVRRYGVAAGRNVLIATNNDSAYALARDLRDAGVAVPVIADSRFHVADSIRSDMRARSIEVLSGFIPIDSAGFGALRAVTLGRLEPGGSGIQSKQTIACDALAVSGGFAPTLHLYAHAGGKLAYDDASGVLRPVGAMPSAIEIVGSAGEVTRIGPRISPGGDPKRKWVDLLHDVTVADLELSQREDYRSVEHVKRFTTVGMAADQGKTSAAATLDTLGGLRGIAPRDLGHTTLRPPFMPVTLGAIAGRGIGEHFAPTRHLPLHDWHVSQRALMHDFGEWQRPVVYPRPGESREDAVTREARMVRNAAGLFDASSLGKIEIHGPDAHDFLDRFYINDLKTLKPLRARYCFMLRESGVLFDDGTVVMLAPDRFVITTTSGNAGRVAQWLDEWRQCEWPQLRVAIVPVTEQWATVSLAGPKSRAILSTLQTDIDLSNDAFPHLSMREGRLLGVPARIYRVSFTGELTYEISVPASKGQALWEALLESGANHGVQPFGMDALMLMRLEKGFLHLGADTDGTTVPDDVGWGKVAANKARDYIGKRSLTLPENTRPDRLQLVGLVAVDPVACPSFTIGSHQRARGSAEGTDGWITSAGVGVLKREPIALAMLRGGRARVGTEVDLYDQGVNQARARVVMPPFLDPAGDRMNV